MPSLPTLWLLKPPPNSIPRRSSTNGGAAPQDVPAALAHRVLDADHLGAEGGQQLGRAGAGQLTARNRRSEYPTAGRSRRPPLREEDFVTFVPVGLHRHADVHLSRVDKGDVADHAHLR